MIDDAWNRANGGVNCRASGGATAQGSKKHWGWSRRLCVGLHSAGLRCAALRYVCAASFAPMERSLIVLPMNSPLCAVSITCSEGRKDGGKTARGDRQRRRRWWNDGRARVRSAVAEPRGGTGARAGAGDESRGRVAGSFRCFHMVVVASAPLRRSGWSRAAAARCGAPGRSGC